MPITKYLLNRLSMLARERLDSIKPLRKRKVVLCLKSTLGSMSSRSGQPSVCTGLSMDALSLSFSHMRRCVHNLFILNSRPPPSRHLGSVENTWLQEVGACAVQFGLGSSSTGKCQRAPSDWVRAHGSKFWCSPGQCMDRICRLSLNATFNVAAKVARRSPSPVQ